MFIGARDFNQNIGGWTVTDVGGSSELYAMFYAASNFNGNIGDWAISNVTTLFQTFYAASSFNQNIAGWNTSNVGSLLYAFYEASSFNQPIGSWDTGKVYDMRLVFYDAPAFDQSLGSWNIASVYNTTSMDAMLTGSGLSNANYSSTLIGWAIDAGAYALTDFTLSASGLYYNSSATAARTSLTDTYGWTITDSGLGT